MLPTTNAKNTVVDGPGVQKNGVVELYPTYFTIETRDKDNKPIGKLGAGQPFEITITGPNGKVRSTLKDNNDGDHVENVCCFGFELSFQELIASITCLRIPETTPSRWC